MKGESINMTRARDKEKIRVPDSVREVMGSIPVGDSDFFIVPSRFETIRYGKHSVRYLGPFLWSKLTDNQRDSPSLHVFINKIRKLNLADLLTNNSNCCKSL